jgi:hypothetical protein
MRALAHVSGAGVCAHMLPSLCVRGWFCAVRSRLLACAHERACISGSDPSWLRQELASLVKELLRSPPPPEQRPQARLPPVACQPATAAVRRAVRAARLAPQASTKVQALVDVLDKAKIGAAETDQACQASIGSLPRLRRSCAWSGLTPAHICAGTGLTPPTSAPGLGSPPADICAGTDHSAMRMCCVERMQSSRR